MVELHPLVAWRMFPTRVYRQFLERSLRSLRPLVCGNAAAFLAAKIFSANHQEYTFEVVKRTTLLSEVIVLLMGGEPNG